MSIRKNHVTFEESNQAVKNHADNMHQLINQYTKDNGIQLVGDSVEKLVEAIATQIVESQQNKADSVNEYTVESGIFFDNEKEKQLVNVMKQHGAITGTAGGFPVSPMVYKWKGNEEGVRKIKNLGVKIN